MAIAWSTPGGTLLNATIVESPAASDGPNPRPWQLCEVGPKVQESGPMTYVWLGLSQASESVMKVENVLGTDGAVRMMVRSRPEVWLNRYQSAPNVWSRFSGSKNSAGLNIRTGARMVPGHGRAASRSKLYGTVSSGSEISRLTPL